MTFCIIGTHSSKQCTNSKGNWSEWMDCESEKEIVVLFLFYSVLLGALCVRWLKMSGRYEHPSWSYDIATITETWWDGSCDWSVAIDGYGLFRRDRKGRKGGGIALYIKRWRECEELSLKNSHKPVESLWAWIRNRGNKGNLVVGDYYRSPNQGETIDEAFLLKLQEALRSHAHILLGDFNHSVKV